MVQLFATADPEADALDCRMLKEGKDLFNLIFLFHSNVRPVKVDGAR